MQRTGQEWVSRYADAIALKLGREAESIRESGLQANDFRETLHFEFDDGSHATFRYAFFIHDAQANALAVFTEHCGYFLFPSFVKVTAESGAILHDGLPK